MRTAVVALVAAAMGIASFASADEDKRGKARGHAKHEEPGPPASRDAKFRAWDKDGDGSISRGEYPGHPGNFRALDTNNDGALTIDEFQHRAGGGAPATGSVSDDFTAKDHDGNGVVSRTEWPDTWEFDRRDHNRDGVVSRDEYWSPREPGARDDEFRGFDRDGDGVISRGEWRGRPSVFDALDTNRDGRVTRAEYVRGSARGRLVK